jgi:hypothetical protein
MLANVPNALSLRAQVFGANESRGELPDQLLVASANVDVSLVRTFDLQTFRDIPLEFVCQSDAQRQQIARQAADIATPCSSIFFS